MMKAIASAVILVLVATVSTSVANHPRCPPGTHLSRRREECVFCGDGHYADVPNRWRHCKKLRMCKSSESVAEEGNPTRNRVCTCAQGERVYYNYDEEHGFDCKECPDGLVPRPVVNRKGTGDVGCCKAHQDAYRDQEGKLTCRDTAVPSALASKPTLASSPSNNMLPPQGAATRVWPYFLLCGIVGFAIGLGAAAVFYYVKLRKNPTHGGFNRVDAQVT